MPSISCLLIFFIVTPTDVNFSPLLQNTTLSPIYHTDLTPENPWSPFPNRVMFAHAWCKFMEVQASESQINKGLDILSALTLTCGGSSDNIPWKNAKQMYVTINSTCEGHVPWKRKYFQYTGTLPLELLKWMVAWYRLWYHDMCLLLHEQLALVEFKDHFDYAPHQIFNGNGYCIICNLMSGNWVLKQAVCDTKLLFLSLHT